MAPIRVGIIGVGTTNDMALTGSWGVVAHLRSIQALHTDYHIVALANSSVESAQRSIQFHKLPQSTKAYGNAEDIAADPDVDLVVITVSVPTHYLLAMSALKHKKSVFIEWPLCSTVKETEELTRVASANGVRTMVGLQGRLDPLVQKVKDILATGKIGRLTSSTVTACTSALPVDEWAKGREFILDFNSGQNEFTVFFGHLLDSFTYLLGDFDEVQALLSAQYKTVPIIDPNNGEVLDPAYPKTAPDHIFIQGTLENKAVASIAFRKAGSAVDNEGFRWYITGTDGEILITTEEGSWQFGKSSERKVLLKIGKEAKTEEVDYMTDDTSLVANVPLPGPNTGRLYENFAKPGGEIVTFDDALKTHRLLARIAEAAGWEL